MNRKIKSFFKALYYSIIFLLIGMVFFYLLCLMFGFPDLVFFDNFD